jgi:hypothetical protein
MKLSLLTLAAFVTLASAAAPNGWIVAGSAPKDYDYGVETQAGDNGKSAYIKARDTAKPTGFGTLMQMVNAEDYRGGRWKLTGRMRTHDAAKAQMWMRVDGPGNAMNAFDNMDDRPVTGDTAWKTYEIVLDVPQDSVAVAFGFFLFGGGEVWADDFKLERVPNTTPVTGKRGSQPRSPANLDFEG